MDMLYSTHLLQPLKCSPANTACLQEWNQGKGLVGMTEKPMDLRSNCDFLKTGQNLLYTKATQAN